MRRISRLVDVLALLVYTLISIVMTWPVTANLRGYYSVYNVTDEYMFMWDFWWMRYSLHDLHTWPFYTSMLYYPFGTGLAVHAYSPLLGVLSIPIQSLWSVEQAYNLATLAAFIFSAFTMYLLANYLVGSKAAGFVSGVIFGFATIKFIHIGQVSVISTEFFPLYVLFFIKMLRELHRRYWFAALAGLCLGFIILVDYYQTVYAVFFSLCYLSYHLLRTATRPTGERSIAAAQPFARPRTIPSTVLHLTAPSPALFQGKWITFGGELFRIARYLLVLTVVFLIIASPLILAAIHDIQSGYYVKLGGEDRYYADIAGFFVPPTNWFKLGWIQQLQPLIVPGGVESIVFLGWTVIALLLVGTLKLTRRVQGFAFWLYFLLLCFLMALGPNPHLGGHPLAIPAPYALWEKIPFLNNARVPGRFGEMVTFAAAIIGGYTILALLRWLIAKLPKVHPNLLRVAVLLLITPTILFEHYLTPVTAAGPALNEPRAAFAQIAAEPGDFAVLDLPLNGPSDPTYGIEHIMYEQTLHHKNALGGSVARPKPEFYEYYANLEYLSILSYEQSSTYRTEVQQVLTNTKAMNFYRKNAANLVYYLDIHYLIVRPRVLPLDSLRFISETLPVTQVYPQVGQPITATVIYRVNLDLLKPLLDSTQLQVGSSTADVFRLLGWYPPARDALGPMAWLGQTQGLLLTPIRQPANYSVTLQLQPMIVDNQPQTLKLYLNDEDTPVATIVLPAYTWGDYHLNINREHWRTGLNTFRLQMSYAKPPGNGDAHTYSLAVRNITFTPQP